MKWLFWALAGSLIGTILSWDQVISCMSGLVTHIAGESGIFPYWLVLPCLPWVGTEHGPLQKSITHQNDILRLAKSWVKCTSVLNKVPTMHLFTLQKYPFLGILLLCPKQTITSANGEHDNVQRKPGAMASPSPCQWHTHPCAWVDKSYILPSDEADTAECWDNPVYDRTESDVLTLIVQITSTLGNRKEGER